MVLAIELEIAAERIVAMFVFFCEGVVIHDRWVLSRGARPMDDLVELPVTFHEWPLRLPSTFPLRDRSNGVLERSIHEFKVPL